MFMILNMILNIKFFNKIGSMNLTMKIIIKCYVDYVLLSSIINSKNAFIKYVDQSILRC